MPGRLGDDPLARAKATPSHAPYNSVFFERRGADTEAAEAPSPSPEAAEISEISEIPEIREVATVPQQPPEAPPPSPATDEVATAANPPASFIEEVVSNFNATASASIVQPEAPAQAKDEAVSIAVESAEAPLDDQLAQSGRFFKRLFGKLGK